MEILAPSGDKNPWVSLPNGISGVEWYGRYKDIPSSAKALHLGDLRNGEVGCLTQKLMEKVGQVAEAVRENPQVGLVVIHAESALGWEDGNRKCRENFWGLLSSNISIPVAIENNIVFAAGERYDYIRFPRELLEEVTHFGLFVALDISHGAPFVNQHELVELAQNQMVKHLHVSDWVADGKAEGKQHLVLGEGTLPIKDILRKFQGDSVTLEVGQTQEAVIRSLAYLEKVSGDHGPDLL